MTAQPEWSPVDDDTADLLSLVATGPLAPDTAGREWDTFVFALRFLARGNSLGRIAPNALRRLVRRGDIAPRRVGAFTHRALSQGLIQATGEWEVSDDRQGKNAGKPARVYRWIGTKTATEPDPLGLGG